MHSSSRRKLALSMLTLLTPPLVARAGMLDKAKAAKASLDKVTYAPVKVPGLSKQILESREDLRHILAAFRKKIGSEPLMVYGVGLNWTNVVTFTYQSRFNPEKMEMLTLSKGEIEGKPRPFKLIGQNVKVEDNVFDFGKVNFEAIPDLLKVAREKTRAETKGKTALGASAKIVQLWTTGQPTQVRIVINVAADDKSATQLVGDALGSLKDDSVAKGSSVGQLVADQSGKILGFKLK
jgi:hypothetical protein